MGDPALVLSPVLVGSVDAALSQDHGVHVEAARVVAHVLVGRALAAAVRAVEVEKLRLLARSVVVVELAVDLVGRGVDDRRVAVVHAHRLEHIEGAARVDVEIGVWIDERSRHRHLRREVKHRVLVRYVPGNGGGVPDVLLDEGRAVGVAREQPLQIPLRSRAAEVVEQRDLPAFLDQVRRGVDAEKTCAAGDQDPAAVRGRGWVRRPGLGEPLVGVHRRYVSQSKCP